MTNPAIMRIELTPQAKAELEKLAAEKGMKQLALMSRLAEWFATEHELVQSAVIGRYPESIQAEVAKIILNRLNAEDAGHGKASRKAK